MRAAQIHYAAPGTTEESVEAFTAAVDARRRLVVAAMLIAEDRMRLRGKLRARRLAKQQLALARQKAPASPLHTYARNIFISRDREARWSLRFYREQLDRVIELRRLLPLIEAECQAAAERARAPLALAAE